MADSIQHRTLFLNGINIHVAEMGDGPLVVIFLHGFPEIWYSWRHQMLYLSRRGFRVLAPDLRGFGDSDAPPSSNSYTTFHVAGDLVALLDEFNLEKVFLVGHDFGAYHAWNFCLLRPDRVRALVNLSVAYRPRHPTRKPVESLRALFGDDYYICRFQVPGEAEEEYGRHDIADLLKKLYSFRSPRLLCVPKSEGFGGPPNVSGTKPSWLSEEDLNYYATKYSQRGFTGGLNHYRALDLNWELLAAWAGVKIEVPVKFIVGDLDMVYNIPGTKDYIHKGQFKRDVPLLEEVTVMEDVAHFINQEKPDEVSLCIYEFIRGFV